METIIGEDVYENKLKTVFAAFDKQNTNRIEENEVGNLLRGLNINPTLQDTADIIKQIRTTALELRESNKLDQSESPENSNYVTYEAVKNTVLPLISRNAMPRATETDLYRAFQALDPENKLMLTKDQIVQYLCKQGGEPLSEEELESMLAAAANRNDGNLYYEDYIKLYLSQ